MSEKDGGSAFPEIDTEPGYTEDHGEIFGHVYSYGGMSLRDWFAGMSIPLAAKWEEEAPTYTAPESSYRGIAERAYFLADAMLIAKERKQP